MYAAACVAADRDVVFRASPVPAQAASEVITVLEPADGQFLYSAEAQKARPRARFAIGSAPRTDFVVYSEEEQVGLQALRDRLAAAAVTPASSASSATSTATLARLSRPVLRHAAPKAACSPAKPNVALTDLAWPKVVRDDNKVCVPKLEFAEQSDWRDHVWCFDKGDGNVR
jgi:hypothetical protein